MNVTKKILPLAAVLAVVLPGGTALAAPKSRVAFSATAYAVAENQGNATITVKRSGKGPALTQTVLVDYSTSSASPNATAEYTPVHGTLTFGPSVTSQTFQVPVTDDGVVGGPVVVNLKLTNARVQSGGRANLTYPSTAVLAIAEADQPPSNGGGGTTPPPAPTFQLAMATDTVGELAGTESAYVIRSGDLTQAASVNYATADGTAKAGTDYTSTSGTLNFPTQASDQVASIIQTISVPILHNTAASAPAFSDFTVNLSNPSSGALLGSPTSEDVTILNQDGSPAIVQFSAPSYSATETAGSIRLTAYLTGSIPAGNEVDVNYATADGTAIGGTNYTPTSDQLQFMPGDVAQYIDVPVLDDGVYGDSSSFTTSLSLAQGSIGAIGSPSTATVSIVDADPQPTATVTPPTIVRDGNGNVVISGSVDLSGPSAQDTTVTVVVTDPNTGRIIGTITVVVPAGQTSATYTYTITPDQLGDAQTVSVGIGDASGAAVAPHGGQGSSATAAVPAPVSQPQPAPTQLVADASQASCGLVVKAAKNQRLLKQKGLKLSVRVNKACKIGLATVVQKVVAKKQSGKAARALRFKARAAALNLGAGKAKTVTVRFSKKTLAAIAKALKARTKLVATVTVTTRDAASHITRKTLRIAIRR